MTLEFRLAKHIEPKHHTILVSMLNESWGDQFMANNEIMKHRFETESFFLACYDFASEEDKEYIFEKYGININIEEKIPVTLLETIDVITQGNFSSIPKSYDELTNYGNWRSPREESDTIIMVDISALPTRRGKKGKKEARRTILYALNMLAKNKDYEYWWTFTPDIDRVKNWHQSIGAENTEYIIPDARPKWKTPSVNVMDYTSMRKSNDIINYSEF